MFWNGGKRLNIQQIKLHNYRGFSDFSASFHEKLTVIVGNNGAGKTSLLDGIAAACDTYLMGFSLPTAYSGASVIKKQDARVLCFDMGSVVDVQRQFPVWFEAAGLVDGRTISWKRSLNTPEGKPTYIEAQEIRRISEHHLERMQRGDRELILPILSYYGTGRLWAQKKEKQDSKLVQFPRQTGYLDCLDAASNEKLMLKWFEKMTLQEAQRKAEIPEFAAVKKAIAECFASITGHDEIEVTFDLDTHGLDIQFTERNGIRKRLPASALSDGYKNTLSMIGDIAYRMAVLNPALLDRVLEKTPGVVLIDEVDLHLHPLWQQRILGDLQRIFPKVQFIVTTHAPAIISSVKRENLLILTDNEGAYSPTCETYGSDANSVLTSIMGASARPVEIKERFDAFYAAVDREEYARAKELLIGLERLIGTDDPEIVGGHVTLDFAEL